LAKNNRFTILGSDIGGRFCFSLGFKTVMPIDKLLDQIRGSKKTLAHCHLDSNLAGDLGGHLGAGV
jgi:hypothetical protein